jgi:uncharacterized protein
MIQVFMSCLLALILAATDASTPPGDTDVAEKSNGGRNREESMEASRIERVLHPVSVKAVEIEGGFWGARQEVNRSVTLDTEYNMCKKTGRLDAWKLDWKPGEPNPPHIFWDSDVAKWIEAAAYGLATQPNPELEQRLDALIEQIAAAQQDDGYLNTHFIVVEPEKRWVNLRDWHELYCAGHLIEAAVAYYEATGKCQLLDTLSRYADYIIQTFGPKEGQRRGYPGHEEIELALVRLYRATGEQRYLDQAKYFVDERGRQPHYYIQEAKARGEEVDEADTSRYAYQQAHVPLRQQTEVVGHAVRAMYLYAGAASVAAETNDQELLDVLRGLWADLTQKKMYITGGLGSTHRNEGFTSGYDLPNENAYAETCAAVGLVFWASRMLESDPDAVYADTMERALYNGALSGVSLDGTTFFYSNPLASEPERDESGHPSTGVLRQPWFECACCPPNIARLIASVGKYVYSHNESEIRVHLYLRNQAQIPLGKSSVRLTQETAYPWEEEVRITVEPEAPARFTLALRMPGWCRNGTVSVNGEEVQAKAVKGYVQLDREWRPGETVLLRLPMPVERVYARPEVSDDLGRVALQRGPVVYCIEEADNGPGLDRIWLPKDAPLTAEFKEDVLGGATVISGEAKRVTSKGWGDALYATEAPRWAPAHVIAVPYCLWNNRGLGEMRVWIREPLL